jgi:hypothetical protein
LLTCFAEMGSVIGGCNRQVRTAHAPALHPKTIECLWRRHFVDKMQVDVEKIGLAFRVTDDVPVPKLFGQCLRC